jgi:hypothetical protein
MQLSPATTRYSGSSRPPLLTLATRIAPSRIKGNPRTAAARRTRRFPAEATGSADCPFRCAAAIRRVVLPSTGYRSTSGVEFIDPGHSHVAITGAWSDGRSSLRGALSITQIRIRRRAAPTAGCGRCAGRDCGGSPSAGNPTRSRVLSGCSNSRKASARPRSRNLRKAARSGSLQRIWSFQAGRVVHVAIVRGDVVVAEQREPRPALQFVAQPASARPASAACTRTCRSRPPGRSACRRRRCARHPPSRRYALLLVGKCGNVQAHIFEGGARQDRHAVVGLLAIVHGAVAGGSSSA